MFSVPTAADPVKARIISQIMRSTRTAFVGQILVLLFADVFFYPFVPLPLLSLWTVLHLLNYYLRFGIVGEYITALEKRAEPQTVDTLFRRYLTSLALTSLLWAAMIFFMPLLPPLYHFVVYSLVLSLTFGATMSIGPLTGIYLAFVAPMNLALMGMLVYFGAHHHAYLVAALFLPVTLFFSAKAAKMHLYDYISIVSSELEAQRLKERFEHKATHDILTGLPNRLKFYDLLYERFAPDAPLTQKAALMFLDLDKFKRINDVHGHLVGDKVLKIVAKRLRNALRKEDTAARFAGDEFVVLIEGVTEEERLEAIAEKIHEAISRPIVLDKITITTAPSIGIARFPADGSDGEALLHAADMAMFLCKKRGLRYLFASRIIQNPAPDRALNDG